MEDFAIIFERAMKAEPKREKKIFMRDMKAECSIDGTARFVMECIEKKLSYYR